MIPEPATCSDTLRTDMTATRARCILPPNHGRRPHWGPNNTGGFSEWPVDVAVEVLQ